MVGPLSALEMTGISRDGRVTCRVSPTEAQPQPGPAGPLGVFRGALDRVLRQGSSMAHCPWADAWHPGGGVCAQGESFPTFPSLPRGTGGQGHDRLPPRRPQLHSHPAAGRFCFCHLGPVPPATPLCPEGAYCAWDLPCRGSCCYHQEHLIRDSHQQLLGCVHPSRGMGPGLQGPPTTRSMPMRWLGKLLEGRTHQRPHIQAPGPTWGALEIPMNLLEWKTASQSAQPGGSELGSVRGGRGREEGVKSPSERSSLRAFHVDSRVPRSNLVPRHSSRDLTTPQWNLRTWR